MLLLARMPFGLTTYKGSILALAMAEPVSASGQPNSVAEQTLLAALAKPGLRFGLVASRQEGPSAFRDFSTPVEATPVPSAITVLFTRRPIGREVVAASNDLAEL